MGILVALALLAQVSTAFVGPPDVDQPAYVVAHPIDPNRLVLATHDARYQVQPLQPCAWLQPDTNVTLLAGTDEVRTVASGTSVCDLYLIGRVQSTPCFVDAAGDCDVAAEEGD